MGGIIAEGALLCCCSCCGEIGTACKMNLGPQKVVKVFYMVLLLLIIVPFILLTLLLSKISGWINLTPTQAIARISVTLLCLFTLLFTLMLCRNKLSQAINEGLFTVKYIFVVVLFIGSLFISQNFFEGYSAIAKYVSILYMLLQSIIIIDLFYLTGSRFAKKYSDGEYVYGGVLIGLTLIFEALAIFLNMLAYIHFSVNECGSTLWLSIVTSCIFVILPLVQLLNLNSQNSLLTTSLISLFIAYMSYSAQLSFGPGCTSRLTVTTYSIDVVVCLCIFIMTTYGSIMGGLSEQPSLQNISEKDLETANQKLYSETWAWVKWHFYMCLASVYLSMILSNWQSTQQIGLNIQGNNFAFWIRAAMSIATALLYIWTMIVPSLFPERDFIIQ